MTLLILGLLGLVVAVVAVLVAVPPVLQMFLGAPKITIGFASGGSKSFTDGTEYLTLGCHIQNQPIRNRILTRWLRLRRASAEGIRVHCDIRSGWGYRLVYSPSGKIFEGGSDRWAVLPPSDVPVRLGVVEASLQDRLVRPFGTSMNHANEQAMDEGEYSFSISVSAQGAYSRRCAHFRVKGQEPFIEWV